MKFGSSFTSNFAAPSNKLVLSSRVLSTSQEIREAKVLVYEIYHRQLKWTPALGNPSGFGIRSDSLGEYLDDSLTNKSIWLGVFESEQMIATARILYPLNGKFETTLYSPIPDLLKSPTNSVEVNRVSINISHQNSPVMAFLILSIARLSRELELDHIFTTASFPEPGNLLTKLGLIKEDNFHFKYSPEDDRPVYIMHFPVNDKLAFERLQNICGFILGDV